MWWEIYLGDRLTSLLVGLPYGLNDVHVDKLVAGMAKESPPSKSWFSLNGALITGRIIDRNISPGKPSFAYAMDLDEQLVRMGSAMPDEWWMTPSELPVNDADLDSVRERLLLQFYYFDIKLYAHLPFIGKHRTDASQHVSAMKCAEAARELLRRYIVFRSETWGPCLYECKTCDFIAFTGVVVILICAPRTLDTMYQLESGDDAFLINRTDEILGKQEQKGCKIAGQCRAALRFLSGGGDNATTDYRQQGSIQIPYFGTLVKQPLVKKPTNAIETSRNETAQRHSMSIQAHNADISTDEGLISSVTDLFGIEYQEFDCTNPTSDEPSWNTGNAPGSDFCSWLDTALLGLDQDWVMFQELTSP